MVTPK